MPSSDEVLIGAAEAAAIVGVARATILRWAEKGDLPYIRKLPGRSGAVLFDAGVVRRKAAERLVHRRAS